MASVAVLNGRHTSGKVILEKSLCGYCIVSRSLSLNKLDKGDD